MGNGIIAGNKNIINRDDLAAIRYMLLGNGVFVNAREGCNFSESHTNKTVTIGKGLLSTYGYCGYLPNTKTFEFVNANTVQYWIIYGELNLSKLPNEFDIKRINNGRSTEISLRQDVLSNEPNGVFQIALWRVKIERAGITEVVDLRGIDAYMIEKGDEYTLIPALMPEYVYTKYTHNPYTGEFTFDESDKIARSNIVRYTTYYMPSNSGSNKAKELYLGLLLYFLKDMTSVKNEQYVLKVKPNYAHLCHNARDLKGLNAHLYSTVEATTQMVGDNSEKIATTEFVHAEIESIISNI